MLKKLLATPLSWIYGGIAKFRHKLFDWGILKSREYDIPIVCVGNLTVGGTGKTPHTEFLIDYLSRNYRVGVLSRGYKRKTRGFVLASAQSSYRKIGDEPKQIKLKFPEIPVAVCESRREGIDRLCACHPEINLIILDDAFQHRYVEPWVNIVLTDYHRLVTRDKFLPLGRLRDSLKQLTRAQFVIVTKCPKEVKPIDLRMISKELDLYPYQSLYFTSYRTCELVPIFPEYEEQIPQRGQSVVGMAGIANPANFFNEMSRRYNVRKTVVYSDHHSYKVRDMNKLVKMLSVLPEDTIVVVTEKDAVKLASGKKIPVLLRKKLYFAPIEVTFPDRADIAFKRQLDQYVRSNQKYSILHPE